MTFGEYDTNLILSYYQVAPSANAASDGDWATGEANTGDDMQIDNNDTPGPSNSAVSSHIITCATNAASDVQLLKGNEYLPVQTKPKPQAKGQTGEVGARQVQIR